MLAFVANTRMLRSADECSRSHIGYNPAAIVSDLDGTYFGRAAEDSSRALTRVMILHPIAAALCFIAFLLCLGTGIIGSLGAVFFALVSFVVTIVAMACDFAAFGTIRSHVNDNGRSFARWGSGIWCILAAALCTLFAAVVVLLTCCAGRSKKEETRSKAAHNAKGGAAQRPFWNRG